MCNYDIKCHNTAFHYIHLYAHYSTVKPSIVSTEPNLKSLNNHCAVCVFGDTTCSLIMDFIIDFRI